MLNKKNVNVLVTGVGALIGQGIIKSLRSTKLSLKIIGIDQKDNLYSQNVCDVFYRKPTFGEESIQYLDFMLELIAREQIDLVLPGIENDVFWFDQQRPSFSDKTRLGINTKELISIGKDKLLTANILEKNQIDPIPYIVSTNWLECIEKLGNFPFIIKPRSGNGSRNQFKIFDSFDLEYALKKIGNSYLVQQIVGNDDEEYTASVFGLGDGNACKPIIFRRKLSPIGFTQNVEVIGDVQISEMIQKLNTIFKPVGPTNYQFRKECEKVYLLEVNPRISSATSIRSGFGYNESLMCIDFYINNKIPEIRFHKGKACRYVEDYLEVDNDCNNI